MWCSLPCEIKCTKIQVYTQHLTSMVTCDETGISLWHDLSHHIQVWDSYKQSKFLIKNLRLNLLQLTVLSSSLTKSSLIFHIPYSKTTLKKTKTCTIPTVMFLPPFHFLSLSHVSVLPLWDIPTSFCVMHSFLSHVLNHHILVLGIYSFPSFKKFIFNPTSSFCTHFNHSILILIIIQIMST